VSLIVPTIVQCPAPVVAGTGLLHLARIGPRTVLQRVFATSPLKILNPRRSDRAAWVYSATYGGGLVGGDAICMTVDMEPGARAVLATQSSTKIYRSATLASQDLTACVNDDGLLVVAPDPIVCFARSSFRQRQRFELSRDANVVVIDWMTSGRRAMGERWAFDRYDGRLELRREGRTILYDSIRLVQDDGPVAERMGRFNVWATVVLTGPLVAVAAANLISDIANLPVLQRSDLVLSAVRLGEDGALLRMAGLSTERVSAVIRQHLSFLAPHLGGELWSRKW
jgi:urease accessory protein